MLFEYARKTHASLLEFQIGMTMNDLQVKADQMSAFPFSPVEIRNLLPWSMWMSLPIASSAKSN
jgi:hypothetical protein